MKVMWHTITFQRTRVVMVVLTSVIAWGVFSIAAPAHAQFSLLSVVSEPCRDCGACSICDLMWVVTKTMRFVLSLAGALALALFIWGGWEMMLSGGKAEEVEHGKKVISGTVVGLVIILLLAWVWPNWVILALKGVPEGGKPQTIFSGDAWWFTPCVQGQALVDPKVCSPVVGGEKEDGGGLCSEINTAGGTVPKPVGTDCKVCEQKRRGPCLCNKNGGCVEACVVDGDCKDTLVEGMFMNYCNKQITGRKDAGFCELKKPGTQCSSDRDCPTIEPDTPFSSDVGMYCSTSDSPSICRIKREGACKFLNQDYRKFCATGTQCRKISPISRWSECLPN